MSIEQILENCITAMQTQSLTAQQCLQRYAEVRDELEPLLRLTERLGSYQAVMAPAEFRNNAALRMRNLVASRPRPVAAVPEPSKRSFPASFTGLKEALGRAFILSSWSPARVLILAVALFLVTFSGVAYAADKALPGNAFYPVKIAVEDIRLSFAGAEEQALNLHLRYAERRLQEAELLATRSQHEGMHAALAAYQEHLSAIVAMLESDDLWLLQDNGSFPADVDRRLASLEAQLARLRSRPELAGWEDLASALAVSQASRQHIADVLHSIRSGHDRMPDPGGRPGMILRTATPSPLPTATATPTPTPTPTATTTPSPTRILVRPRPSPIPRPPLLVPPFRPTDIPGRLPGILPTLRATLWPSDVPTALPTRLPPALPTGLPTAWPTGWPTDWPTDWPTAWPTDWPNPLPTVLATVMPTGLPGDLPTPPPRPTRPAERPTRRP